MLSSVFPTLYDMSAGASILIAAVLLFRFFVRKFPKKYILLLWTVVLFRLLCPLQPTSNLSMIPPESVSFARDTTLAERSEISVLSAADAALRAIGDAANGGLDTIYIDLDRTDIRETENSDDTPDIPDTKTPSDTAEPTDTAMQVVSAYHDQVWLLFLEKLYPLGMLVLLAYQTVSLLRLRGRLRTAVPYPGAIPDGILPQGCEILYADSIPSAFVMGIFRPRIYLPSARMSDTAQDDPALLYVLSHEGVHLRRRDPLWKTLWFLALCLHWYHPLVWAAFFCVSADLEYRCDEDALRVLASVTGQPQDELAAPYAEALLSLSTAKRRPLGMLSLDAGNVSGRIRRLLGSKPKRAMCVIMAVCCLFLCLMGIGNPPTKYPVDNIVACTLDGQQITPEHGIALVDALNSASRTVNRTYDAVGRGTLDHLAVVTYADGSYLEVNYLYVSDYSFHPAHPGEDDYKTVLWYRDARGNAVETYVMEYDFDAVFREWMIASEQTPDHGDILVHAPSDSENGIAVVILDDRQTIDVPLLPVAYDRSVDYDRVPVITLRGDAVLRITGISGNTLRVGEDYYEYRGSSSTFIDQETFTLEAEKDGAFVLPITYRNPQREESAVYYVAAEETRYCFKIRFVPSKVLTLDDVRTLSEKGMALTWEDFADYKSTVTGSGLYIRIYEIDETFELWIGGGAPMGEPMYVYLARKDDFDMRIDIRYGGVEEFIEEIKAETILRATSDSEIGRAVLVTDDGLTYDLAMLAVPYDKSLDYDRLPEITVSSDAVIQLLGFEGDTLRVGEDYYEIREEHTHITQQTLTLTPDDDGSFSYSVAHRHPNQYETVIYYIAAEDTRYCFRISLAPIPKIAGSVPVPDIPQQAWDYYEDIVTETSWEYFNSDMGGASNPLVFERISTEKTISLYSDIQLYHVEYWVSKGIAGLDCAPEDIVFKEIYFVLLNLWEDGTDTWKRLGTITPEEMDAIYNTPEMIQWYGDKYNAAALEMMNHILTKPNQ